MIYLVMKITGYLLFALLLGGAAGWLLRNLVAMKREEEFQRVVNDARARVPPLETQVRAGETRIVALGGEQKRLEEQVESLQNALKEVTGALRLKERECKALETRQLSLENRGQADELLPADDDHFQIVQPAAQAPDESAAVSAEQIQVLEQRLQAQMLETERLAKALEQEQRRVLELQRERELQKMSLQVLHQQLELEQERSRQGKPPAQHAAG